MQLAAIRFFTCLVAVCAGVLAAGAQPAATCRGTDMFEELRTTDAQAHVAVVSAARAWINSEAILWKIEKQGTPPSFLFGTVHVSDPRVTTLSKATEAALQSSNTVVVEVADLSDNAMAEAMSTSPQLVAFADGRSLQTLLTPAEYDKVKATVVKHQIPPEMAPVFRPWLVSMLLAISDCERQQVTNGAVVLDDKISRMAKAVGKTVVGLETASEQVKALASVDETQQLQMLKASLFYADRLDDTMETILQMYLQRRMSAALPLQSALAVKAGIPSTAFQDFEAKLIVKRNGHMRDRSLGLLEKGGIFIAVGGLHLPGPDGLVAHYRKAGFTVTAVE